MSGKRLLKSMLAQTGSLNKVRQDLPSQASVSAGSFADFVDAGATRDVATEGAREKRSLARLPRPRAAGHDSARSTAQRHSLLTSSHLTPFAQKANLTGRPRPPRDERGKGQ